MSPWMRIGLLVGMLGVAGLVSAASLAGLFNDEFGGDRYDCSVVLHPAAQLAETHAVVLTLEAAGHDALHICITRRALDITATVNGQVTHPAPVAAQVKPGSDYALIVMRRGDWLGVLHEQTFLFRGEVPRASGSQGGFVADEGWTVDEPHVQRLEPVVFADNFMRTAENNRGSWTPQRGSWALQSAWDEDPKGNASRFANIDYSQNPFAWAGRSAAGESALCTTGKTYWEDYTFTTALQPGADGAAGIMVNMADSRNGYLVRWSPANDRGPRGDSLSIAKLPTARRLLWRKTTADTSRGSGISWQWCPPRMRCWCWSMGGSACAPPIPSPGAAASACTPRGRTGRCSIMSPFMATR